MNTRSDVGCKISTNTYRKLNSMTSSSRSHFSALILTGPWDLVWNLLVYPSERNVSRDLSTGSKNDRIYSLKWKYTTNGLQKKKLHWKVKLLGVCSLSTHKYTIQSGTTAIKTFLNVMAFSPFKQRVSSQQILNMCFPFRVKSQDPKPMESKLKDVITALDFAWPPCWSRWSQGCNISCRAAL